MMKGLWVSDRPVLLRTAWDVVHCQRRGQRSRALEGWERLEGKSHQSTARPDPAAAFPFGGFIRTQHRRD